MSDYKSKPVEELPKAYYNNKKIFDDYGNEHDVS